MDLKDSRRWRKRRRWWRNGGNRGRWSFRRLLWMEDSDQRRGTGASPRQWCQCSSSSINLQISDQNRISLSLSLNPQQKQGRASVLSRGSLRPRNFLVGPDGPINGSYCSPVKKLPLFFQLVVYNIKKFISPYATRLDKRLAIDRYERICIYVIYVHFSWGFSKLKHKLNNF